MNTHGQHIGTVLNWIAKVGILFGLILAGQQVGDHLTERLTSHLTPSTEPAVHRMIMVTVVVYVLLTALPFVPGAEIGLSLMLMFGAPIVPVVYGATVVSMALAFLVGRLLPQNRVIALMHSFRIRRMAEVLERLQPMGPAERVHYIVEDAPRRIIPFAIRFRYLGFAVLINLPGNSILGGGGGLSMMAGFSRVFSLPAFVLTVSLAILPVPLLFYIRG
jgi:hypothetical protein